MPDFKDPSPVSLVTVLGLSLTIGISSFLNSIRPNLFARFLVLFNITNLLLASAIHGIGTALKGWIWIVFLLVGYILVWVSPYLNIRFVKSQSNINRFWKVNSIKGRMNNFLTLLLLVSIGGFCSLFSFYSRILWDVSSPVLLVIGVISAILSFSLGQYFSYHLWKEMQN